MVQALSNEVSRFYQIPWGEDGGKIENISTRSNIVQIPGTGDKKYEILATAGPKDKAVLTFWRGLVLGQGLDVIVNLCSVVGGIDAYSQCDQYWPLEGSLTFKDSESKVVVTFKGRRRFSAKLWGYELEVVQNSLATDELINSRDVTLIHFTSWED